MRRRGLITPRAAMECTDWTSFALLSSAVFIIFADQNLMVTIPFFPGHPGAHLTRAGRGGLT